MEDVALMKGSYILLLELNESQQISVGRLGGTHFIKGFYTYVGSSLNGLESRVARHLRQSRKRHWHIDYLLDRAIVFGVILIPGEQRLECILAQALGQRLLCIRRFGSSDCRCPGHLFFTANKSELEAQVVKTLADLGFTYYRHPVPAPRLPLLLPEN